MEKYKKIALDQIALDENLTEDEIVDRLLLVFDNNMITAHAVISFASSMVVRKAKSDKLEGMETMKSLLDDIQTLKRLAFILVDRRLKTEDYDEFI